MLNQVPLHVSLIAIPEVAISTLHGIYDVLNAFGMLAGFDAAIPDTPPFRVEIVGAASGPLTLAGGLTTQIHRSIGEIAATDIVIVPSVLLGTGGWRTGRYPELVDWLGAMQAPGAPRCPAGVRHGSRRARLARRARSRVADSPTLPPPGPRGGRAIIHQSPRNRRARHP